MEDGTIVLLRPPGEYPFLTVRRGVLCTNIEASGGRVLARMSYSTTRTLYEKLGEVLGLKRLTDLELARMAYQDGTGAGSRNPSKEDRLKEAIIEPMEADLDELEDEPSGPELWELSGA